MKRICKKCCTEKDIKEFVKAKRCNYGYSFTCKDCYNLYLRTSHKRKLSKQRYNKSDKGKACDVRYQAKPKNKEKAVKYRKMLIISGKRSVHKKRYYQKNKNDPKFILCNRMRKRIHESLCGGKDFIPWLSLVDYSIDDLKKHIERQFVKGMTWKNHGEWHIDHKIPIAAFNFTKPEHEDFKKCWALKNLQPLWAKDNLKKSCKIKKQFQPSLLF